MSINSVLCPTWQLPWLARQKHNTSTPIGKGPWLGLDWGKKRSGLAVSDPELRYAMPLQVVTTGPALRYALLAHWQTYAAQCLIVGWPMHQDHNPTSLAPAIMRLAQRLRQDHGWPVILWDETLSTQMATWHHHTSPPPRRLTRRRARTPFAQADDAYAAANILQGALYQWHALVP